MDVNQTAGAVEPSDQSPLAARCRTSGCAAWPSATATSPPSTASTSTSRTGEFFTLLGPSGSGKTTTLRLIAGFELPDDGHRRAAAAATSRALPPYARDVNTVFQDYALFPHMTVGENVEYGLRIKQGRQGASAARRADEALEMVRLAGLRRRASPPSSPAASASASRSRARSSTARSVLLLDEPLGALDLKLRQEMQVELKRIQREVGITFVYVTHDQEEALTMSDRLAVFNEGRIEQVGAPAEVYEHPATEFVAGFVGVSNVLERDGRRFTVRPEKIRLLDDGAPADGLHVERGHGRATSATPGWSRATSSTLDAGGELQVVRQNLETTSAEALEAARAAGAGRVARGADVRDRRGQGGGRDEGLWIGGARADRRVLALAAVAAAATTAAARRRAAASRRPRAPKALDKSVGQGEGQLNLIAWAGYVEDGSTDPKVDWVTDFEKQTGCQVNVKIGNTSDEMVTLMRTGQYDGVSASGDATLRLIAGGDVAPVNTDLVPNYADVFDGAQEPAVELGRRPDVRHPARPRREPADVAHGQGQAGAGLVGRGVRPGLAVQGQGHGLRQPDLHRRRGAVPEGDAARPEDRQPLRARRQAVPGGGRPAQDSSARTSASTGRTTPRSRPRSPTATRWSARPGRSSRTCSQADKVHGQDGAARRRARPGWSDTWMISSKAKHPNCMYMWMNQIISPKANAAGGGVVRRGAVEREGVRARRR